MQEQLRPIGLEDITGVKNIPDKPRTAEEVAKMIEEGRLEYEKRKNQLGLEAVYKHVQAVSYRNFRVGASVIAQNPLVKGGYQIESGHNFKPREHRQFTWDKLCAENNACSTVILDGATYISGLVVASHHKVIGSEKSDKTHSKDVLHSCLNCRNLFRDLIKQGIMSWETKIRFIDDGVLVYKDENDMEEYKGAKDDPEEIIRQPKLKLKMDISEEDIAKLPFEEMTMREFLSLPEYAEDENPIAGYTPPPYTLVPRV